MLGLAVGTLTAGFYFFGMLHYAIAPDLAWLVGIPGTLSFTVPLLGWLIQRTVGAIAATVWLIRGTLPDSQWASKVIAYETPVLWVIGVCSGVLLVSFSFFHLWMSRSNPGRSFLSTFGMRPERASVFVGTGVLCLLWLWRFLRAGKAIRWSNF
jgi:hypothetical protein